LDRDVPSIAAADEADLLAAADEADLLAAADEADLLAAADEADLLAAADEADLDAAADEDNLIAAADDLAEAAGDLAADSDVFAAAEEEEEEEESAALDAGDFLAIPHAFFVCSFADDGALPLLAPKLLLPALPMLLPLLPLLPMLLRGVWCSCRGVPARRAVDAPLQNTVAITTHNRFKLKARIPAGAVARAAAAKGGGGGRGGLDLAGRSTELQPFDGTNVDESGAHILVLLLLLTPHLLMPIMHLVEPLVIIHHPRAVHVAQRRPHGVELERFIDLHTCNERDESSLLPL
jgi:hypothetical protein